MYDMELSFVLDFWYQPLYRDVVVSVIFLFWDRFGELFR